MGCDSRYYLKMLHRQPHTETSGKASEGGFVTFFCATPMALPTYAEASREGDKVVALKNSLKPNKQHYIPFLIQ